MLGPTADRRPRRRHRPSPQRHPADAGHRRGGQRLYVDRRRCPNRPAVLARRASRAAAAASVASRPGAEPRRNDRDFASTARTPRSRSRRSPSCSPSAASTRRRGFSPSRVNGAVVRARRVARDRARSPATRSRSSARCRAAEHHANRTMRCQRDRGPADHRRHRIASRLFVGTAGYPNQQVMLDALEASGAELVTAVDPPHQPRRLCREPGRPARRPLPAAAQHRPAASPRATRS